MQRGWIKLWRKLQDLTLWSYSDEPFCKRAAWIDLLLMTWAKEKEFFLNAQRIKLKPGQMVISIRFLAAKWRWSPEKLKNFLNLLVELKMIEKKAYKYGTVVTICNWEIYQQNFKVDDTPTDTPTNTPTNTSTDTLTERPPAQNKEVIKKVKDCKKVKELKPKTLLCSRNQKPEFLERAEMLRFLILQNNPKAKTPSALDGWVDTVRLMVERDGRTLEEIDFVIGFSQKDDFWRRNILSMEKLRKQFDQLWMKGQPKTKHAGIRLWLDEQRVKYGQS